MFSSTFAQLRNLIKTAAAATTVARDNNNNKHNEIKCCNSLSDKSACLPACLPCVLGSVFVFGGICFGPSKNIKSPSQVAAGQTALGSPSTSAVSRAPLSISLSLTNLMKQCVSCVKVSSNKRIRICIYVSFRYNSIQCTHCCYLCGNQSCVAIRGAEKPFRQYYLTEMRDQHRHHHHHHQHHSMAFHWHCSSHRMCELFKNQAKTSANRSDSTMT